MFDVGLKWLGVRDAPLPNFLVAGAPRSGTTTLYELGRRHPRIFVPSVKEPKFFASFAMKHLDPKAPHYARSRSSWRSSIGSYRRLYCKADSGQKIGDFSPQYLMYHELAIPEIRLRLGSPQIVLSLRDPVQRAVSGYRLLRRTRATKLTFREILDRQDEMRDSYPPFFLLLDMSLYSEGVNAYQDAFSKVEVLFFDDLVSDPGSYREKFFRALGVEDLDCHRDGFSPTEGRRSRGSKPPTYSREAYSRR